MIRNPPAKPCWLLALVVFVVSGNLWAGEAFWIDVRSAEEYATGHVSPAVNIPHTEIVARIGEVTTDKDAEIYLYCRSGRRSGLARDALEQAGYTNVVNLGGLAEAQAEAARLATCVEGQGADC
jgi:phage shock protein E